MISPNWTVESLVAGRTFDFTKPLLPEKLARTAYIRCLAASEKLKLNHVRGFTYLALIDLIEATLSSSREYIVRMALDEPPTTLHGDDHEDGASPRLAEDDGQHIELVEWYATEFEKGFGTHCELIGPATGITDSIRKHSRLGHFLTTLCLESYTRSHYLEIARDAATADLDPLFAGLLKHRWMKELQRTTIDTLVCDKLGRTLPAAEIEQGINDFLSIGWILDGAFAEQIDLDLESLQRAIGRILSKDERAEIKAVQLPAYRWTFLLSGINDSSFDKCLRELSPKGYGTVKDAARALSGGTPVATVAVPTTAPMDAGAWVRARRDLERSVKDEVAARFGGFLRTQVNPGAAERDDRSETIPRSMWEQAGRLGLVGYALPKAVGGGGHDLARFGLLLEELGYLCDDSSFGVLLGLRAGITHNLWELGRADVTEKYVIPLARGTMGVGFAYTEDADAFSFRSTARRKPDGRWVLNGVKRPVFGGQTADVVLTYVRGEDDDMLAFLIERDDPGIELRPIEVNGLRSNGPCLLRMNEAVLAPERLVVRTDGFSHAQYSLNWRRLLLACGPLGRMRAFLDDVIAAVSGTIRQGVRASEFSPVQAQLGRMALSLMTARAMTWEALAGLTAGGEAYWDAVSSAAKYVIAEQANAMYAIALRPLATHAYIDGRFARYQRDFATLVTVSGTNDSIERNLGELAVRDFRRRGARP